MAKSVNKVILVGNLTKDPELRYTPSGAAVVTMNLATNYSYKSGDERKEEVEYHRMVAWSKLAEICSQYLTKGSKIYVEGRLKTRKWTDQNNIERYTTEVIISDMVMLSSKNAGGTTQAVEAPPTEPPAGGGEQVDVNDIPF